ncbi:MAG: HAD family hydrolase [Chloroflexi bacterium]|nr:MAG: HAD family hydrolase [Chloroflexota bacterium]MBL1194546.1 HAD family hydrolase [Chloroflexota bacterium]NOH11834.1 HAD family hydrolase [Chloroflexota bacterium]
MVANGYTTLIFDLDGTLRHNRPEGHQVFWARAAELGAPAAEENRRQAQRWGHQYWTNSGDLIDDLELYGRDNPEFWLNYAQRHLMALGSSQKQAAELAPLINQHMREEFEPEDWVDPQTPEMLEGFKEQGYALGVVTNRDEPVQDYLDEKGIGGFFDFILAAGEIGIWKPDSRVFEHALKEMGAEPGMSVYIGDNYFADVLGAQSAGIQPVLVDPHKFFPEAECPVVDTIIELPALLNNGFKPNL